MSICTASCQSLFLLLVLIDRQRNVFCHNITISYSSTVLETTTERCDMVVRYSLRGIQLTLEKFMHIYGSLLSRYTKENTLNPILLHELF